MFGRHRENTDFLILALSVIFLFRTFVAEPFQVPTGSMGPTLLGRHKTAICPHCAFPVICSSSDEIDLKTGESWQRLVSAECPNCRGEIDISATPSRDGDRILVLKNPLSPYRRFDIAVFKNIDSPRSPYVKRLVGMPGETIRLNRGEVEKLVDGQWTICRKTPEQVLSTAVTVYDDRFLPSDSPRRWQSTPSGSWKRTGNGYTLAEPEKPAVLEYQHILRSHSLPRLITDDLGYNSALSDTEAGNAKIHRTAAGHPVSDLLIEFDVQQGKSATLTVELRSGSNTFALSLDTSSASVHWNGKEIWARAGCCLPECRVRFGHVDQQLLFWENDVLVGWVKLNEGGGANFPSEKDLCPVSLRGKGRDLRVSDLVLYRDIYYTRRSQASDYFRPAVRAEEMDAFLSEPSRWKKLREIKAQAEPWILGEGEYVALGDNSLQSNDSRHWRGGPIVKEKMILGRADWFLWPATSRESLRIR